METFEGSEYEPPHLFWTQVYTFRYKWTHQPHTRPLAPPLWKGEKPLEVKNPLEGGKYTHLELLRSLCHLYWNSLPKRPLRRLIPLEEPKTTPLEETKSYLTGGILGEAKG